jgi:4-oxalocrotonate tautomerase
MPAVHIDMAQGRTSEMKEDLIKKVTDAVVDSLKVPKEAVHIVLNEIPRENFGNAGIPLSKKK